MANGSQEHHTKGQRFKEYGAQGEKHASLGTSDAQGINHLFSLNDEFETNPIELLSRTIRHVPMMHQ
jgi:hypothetical protein